MSIISLPIPTTVSSVVDQVLVKLKVDRLSSAGVPPDVLPHDHHGGLPLLHGEVRRVGGIEKKADLYHSESDPWGIVILYC